MPFTPNRTAGLERLRDFLPRAGAAYANNRNYDDGDPPKGMRQNVSQLSPWLHSGLLSEAETIEAVLAQHSASSADKFIAEVFWRVYFKGYLEQRPSIWADYCVGRDQALAALKANSGIAKAYSEATEGRTGIAAFDHWANELAETGYLHNHARMWFASIWIFTLKLDWHLGADFFLRHLIDGDAASNTLSWRWVGGLHTKGKTYLARADNIARYTANHPKGPLAAEGLTEEAPPLEEAREHGRQKLDLPVTPSAEEFEAPYALLLHDEASGHVPLSLPLPPALVIGASRPSRRSPEETGSIASRFSVEAVQNGGAEAAAAFSCQFELWSEDAGLIDMLSNAGLARLAVPYLPTGWTRDALMPDIDAFASEGTVFTLIDDLNRATWPHARAGFFGVKKQIPAILGELGVGGF